MAASVGTGLRNDARPPSGRSAVGLSAPRQPLAPAPAAPSPRRGRFLTLGAFSLRSRGFGQSNSLPTAGSAGAGLGRRNPRQFQIPSRNLPTARLGLLGPSGLLGTPQRSPAASPAILKQGRQVGRHLQLFHPFHKSFPCFSSSNLSGFPFFSPPFQANESSLQVPGLHSPPCCGVQTKGRVEGGQNKRRREER